MQDFEHSVPFDPGFSSISFSFTDEISFGLQEYNSLKAQHQKKFWLMKFEAPILDLINKSAAFYLGCMLWGGFISCRFKDSPKEITGNTTNGFSEEELKNLDCAVETKAILQYLQSLDKDCKYFLKRPAKIPKLILDILDAYIEFVQINNNFINIKNTNDVKITKIIAHFENLSNEQLDKLSETIYSVIESGKIETLLDIGLYDKL